MQAVTINAQCDLDSKGLEMLLEVFGSQLSLEDIATAYCQARSNIDAAGEILSTMIGDTSKDKLVDANATSLKLTSELGGASVMSPELSSDNVDQKLYHGERNSKTLKSKKCSVSVGTVSGIIGKEYVRPRPLANVSCEATKPIKIDSAELPITEIWSEEVPPSTTASNGTMHTDVEEFLFKMLGEGFQLDMNVIHEVLGLCGYDMEKSMETLFDLSASTMEKSDNVVGIAVTRSAEKCPERESILHQEQLQYQDSARRDKDRVDLQKEVLEALFTVPERSEEAPKKNRLFREVRRSRAFGQLVVEPFKETTQEYTAAAAESQDVPKDDEDDENSFEVLRKAVKEYWVTTKEYYKAAIDAYVKGDHARANKLMEEGHFFKQKAQEADEKSTEKLIGARNDEIVSFDLHDLKPKEAVRQLRLRLTSLSGIPFIKYFRVTMGTDEEDTTKGARKRRVMKQLEKESINWTEEENGRKIMIRVDVINPKRLSFAKKK